MNLRSLQHVSTPYPPGRRDEVRAFYTEALGLTEIPIPHTLRAGLVWYSVGDGLELHFFPGELAPGSQRHFCLDVENLDVTREQLTRAGLEPYDDTPIPNRPRFFCRDPFGNLIEFTSIQGSYLPPHEAGFAGAPGLAD